MASASNGDHRWFTRLGVALAGGAIALLAPALGAQDWSRTRLITGTVRDSAGAEVVGAEVEVATTLQRAITDERGVFRLDGVPTGSSVLRVRRLGFRPDTVALRAGPGDTSVVDVRLNPVAQRLFPVVVVAGRAKYSGRLAGYYQRLERRSSGYFITREDIDREQPRLLTHLLQRVPGLQSMRGRGAMPSVIRMRGRTCAPLVWMDGSPALAGDVDLDSFAPSSLEGIELYLGATGAPGAFQWTREASNCGTILLWSRESPSRPRQPPNEDRTGELQQLVDVAALFTAADVDTAARPIGAAGAAPLTVAYPPSLRASGASGHVVAEFVVDTTGHTVVPTIGIVSSTHPLFSEAVEAALPRAMFEPAVRRGRRVPQLVQQRFDFVPTTAPRAHR